MVRKFLSHVCRSNALGYCGACRAEGLALAAPVTGAVKALRARRAFERDRAEAVRSALYLSNRLGRAGLTALAPKAEALAPRAERAESREALAPVLAKLATYTGEAERAERARERRNAKAAERAESARERKAAERRAEAERLRDPEAVWTVAVRFARGARDLRVVRLDSLPNGYRESRAALDHGLDFRSIGE